MSNPRLAIIGKGHVGQALRRGAERAGYPVRMVGSDPAEARAAGAWGEIVVLAVPSSARELATRALGDLRGKVIVDPTNLVGEDGEFVGDPKLSGAEQIQRWAPEAKVVKAFNTVFAQNMSTGTVHGEAIGLFVAGDDPAAKRIVLEFGRAIGFQPIDSGPLAHARWLETLGFFCIQLAYGPSGLGPGIGLRLSGTS